MPDKRIIVIVCAMQDEAKPIIHGFDMTKTPGFEDPIYGRTAYECELPHATLRLITTGYDAKHGVSRVGTLDAALTTEFAINKFKPELIISAGTSGAFKQRGAKVGEVYLSHGQFNYHDQRIPLPHYQDYARGGHPSLDVSHLAKALTLKLAAISTGNSLDITADDLAQMPKVDAVIKEMEATAIAKIAELYKVPMFALKSVTDFIDEPNGPDQFLGNFSEACGSLTRAISKVIDFIGNKPLTALARPSVPDNIVALTC